MSEKKIEEVMINAFGNIVSISEDKEKEYFSFNTSDKTIELNSALVESMEPMQIAHLINAISRNEKNMTVKATKKIRGTIDFKYDDSLYFFEKSEINKRGTTELREITKERKNANIILDQARKIVESINIESEDRTESISIMLAEEILRISKGMPDGKKNTSNDQSSVNKSNETVYTRHITHNEEIIGEIEYLENEKDVQILHSQIKSGYRGKGLGIAAYEKLIDEKLRAGKIVGSDAIVSQDAQNIYSSLEKKSYNVKRKEARFMYPGKLITLTQNELDRVRESVPLIYVDGARVSEPGHRIPGNSCFKIYPEQVAVGEIKVIDKENEMERRYKITKDSIEIRSNYPTKKLLSEEQSEHIEKIFKMAKSTFAIEENKEYSDSIKGPEILAFKTVEIQSKDIEYAFEPEVGMQC